jgi:HAE1 family hydrophobic/amphiphilic exporter-1
MIKDEDEGSLTENFVHQLDNFPQNEESDDHA